jgi:hypothetical protein
MVGKLTAPARRRRSRRSEPVDQYLGPGDGSVHDDYVYAGWELLDPFTRYGSAVPRIWTPPLAPLVPAVVVDDEVVRLATTWGYEVIDFARDVLDLELMPWQRWLLIHMLELEYDEDDVPLLRFEKAVVLVARQNGKSTLSQVLALWFMIMAEWPVVLGTAQDLPTAEAIWEGAVSLLQDDKELAPLVANVSGTNGMKSMTLVDGPEYIVKAANRRAGRGLTGNLIMLDELREQQNWQAWSAITKTTQAQDLSLILGLSNAGDMTSVVLMYLRLAAHAALGDPDGILHEDVAVGPSEMDVDTGEDLDEDEIAELLEDMEADEATIFLAEWSATPGLAIKDRSGWVQANPALGHRIGERKISGQTNEPEWVFRTEVLCQWPDSALNGPFPPGQWEKGWNEELRDDDGQPYVVDADRMVGIMHLGLDQSTDRGTTSLVASGKRADGKDQVVLIARRAGTDWIRGEIENHPLRARFATITGQGRGAPITPYLKTLEENPIAGLTLKQWVGTDLVNGCAWLFDAVRDEKLRHHKSPALDIAAATAAIKRLQDGFVYDRSASPGDIGPLMAAAAALWLLRQAPAFIPPPPPPPRAVEAPTTGTSRGDDDDLSTMSF